VRTRDNCSSARDDVGETSNFLELDKASFQEWGCRETLSARFGASALWRASFNKGKCALLLFGTLERRSSISRRERERERERMIVSDHPWCSLSPRSRRSRRYFILHSSSYREFPSEVDPRTARTFLSLGTLRAISWARTSFVLGRNPRNRSAVD